MRYLARLLLLLPLLAACTAPAATPAPSGGAAPTGPKKAADQVLKITTAPFTTMAPEGNAGAPLYNLMYDSLLYFDKDFVLKPGAAEKWEYVDAGPAWRVTLRKDLTFGNGEKATSADMVNWFEYILKPNPSNTVGGQLIFVSGVKAVDEYTFDLTLKQKDYSTPYVFPNIWLVSKKAFDTAGGGAQLGLNPKGAGTGPYEISEYRAPEAGTFIKRPSHPFRKPEATSVSFRVVPEQSQRIVGLKTGDADIVLGINNADLIDSAKRDGMTIDVSTDSYTNWLFDQKNANAGALKDIKVRQALNYAVDKETIAKNIFKGYAVPNGQFTPPGALNYDPNIKPYPYDPAKAKQLLAEAGYPNGLQLKGIVYSQAENQQLFLAVQANHRDVGITYELQPLEIAQFVAAALGNRERPEMISAGGANTNGMHTFTWQFLKCDKPENQRIWCNPGLDAGMNKAYSEPDPVKRAAALKEATKAWSDDVPMLFLLGTPSFVVTGPKIMGLVRPVPFYYTFDSVYRAE